MKTEASTRKDRRDARTHILEAVNSWRLRRYRGSGHAPPMLGRRQFRAAARIARARGLVDADVLEAGGVEPAPASRTLHPLEGTGIARPPRPERRARRSRARARTGGRPGGRI